MRLLWVENHAVFARIAGQQFLSSHDVSVVPSLAAAKAALATGPFDVVLLDYDLDDGKGDRLIDFIRCLPFRVAVVATSSHEEGNRALLAAGANAACPKAQFADIDAVLRSVVPESRREEPGPPTRQ
jgi:DNA-binding NarL/FixJ family response regulator